MMLDFEPGPDPPDDGEQQKIFMPILGKQVVPIVTWETVTLPLGCEYDQGWKIPGARKWESRVDDGGAGWIVKEGVWEKWKGYLPGITVWVNASPR